MRQLLNNYKASLNRVNELEKIYETEPDNETVERAYDEAYNKNFNDYVELANAIVKATDNKIDFNTAKTMIVTRLETLEAIIELA